MSGPIAQLSAVTKRFGSVQALDNLTLAIGRGELVALLGPNGAGKSTAIALLLGLQRPDAGSACLFGEAPSAATRRRVGVMMQEVGLAPENEGARAHRNRCQLLPGGDVPVI